MQSEFQFCDPYPFWRENTLMCGHNTGFLSEACGPGSVPERWNFLYWTGLESGEES